MNVRLINKGDSENFYHLVRSNYDRIVEYFPKTVNELSTIEDAEKRVSNYLDLINKKELFVYVVEGDKKSMLGILIVKSIDWHVGKCEIGYYVDKENEGKGVTSKAIARLIKIVFKELGLKKIYARVAPVNVKSSAVLLKNGFIKEGVLRKEYKTHSGKLIDVNYYGLLSEDVH